MPIIWLQSVLFSAILYWMCGLNDTEGNGERFLYFTLVFWLLMEAGTAFNQFAATLSPSTGLPLLVNTLSLPVWCPSLCGCACLSACI